MGPDYRQAYHRTILHALRKELADAPVYEKLQPDIDAPAADNLNPRCQVAKL
jgi:hypothetical protein